MKKGKNASNIKLQRITPRGKKNFIEPIIKFQINF